MSVKLSRYVFRRIGGRIVPIRKDALEKTIEAGVSGISKNAFKKLSLLLKSSQVKLTKAFNIRKISDFSGTDAMNKFMRQTGSVRVSKNSKALSIDPETKLTGDQIRTLEDMSFGVDDFYINNESSRNLRSLLVKAQKGKPSSPRTKIADKLDEKALAEYGITDNPNVAGYINRKGEMLNFSGGGYGERYLDHRDVSGIVSSPSLKKLSDKEINRIIRDQQSIRQRTESGKHELTHAFNMVKKYQKLKKGDDFYPVKSDLIQAYHSKLVRESRYGRSEKATNLLKRLKKRQIKTGKKQ